MKKIQVLRMLTLAALVVGAATTNHSHANADDSYFKTAVKRVKVAADGGVYIFGTTAPSQKACGGVRDGDSNYAYKFALSSAGGDGDLSLVLGALLSGHSVTLEQSGCSGDNFPWITSITINGD